jgi:hypothetical protein
MFEIMQNKENLFFYLLVIYGKYLRGSTRNDIILVGYGSLAYLFVMVLYSLVMRALLIYLLSSKLS